MAGRGKRERKGEKEQSRAGTRMVQAKQELRELAKSNMIQVQAGCRGLLRMTGWHMVQGRGVALRKTVLDRVCVGTE